MKKIGIITHYYRSYNYGGNLQAYALVKFLNQHGYDAKQICYCANHIEDNSIIKEFKNRVRNHLANVKWFIADKSFYLQKKGIEKRNRKFIDFQNAEVDHTICKYDDENLTELNQQFDCFITGSDQVFNYNSYASGYWLEFSQKPKISYAASMALDSIPSTWVGYTKKVLADFKSIGVREEKTQELYSELLGRSVVLNVDPVFLLDEVMWGEISTQQLYSDYVFAYFIGNNPIGRAFAKEYAQKNKLKLVCIPFCYEDGDLLDTELGDISLFDAGPKEFVSLIQHADAVFTDSFHASAFSLIFKKPFAVFNRNASGEMSSRITSLLKLFHCENRFLKSQVEIAVIESLFEPKSDFDCTDFERLKEKSMQFLLDSME